MKDPELDPRVANVNDLVLQIMRILAGHEPEIQSAALADLMAMWLAGHINAAGPDGLALLEFREQLFAQWCETVRRLVPVNVAAIRERLKQ